MRLLVSSLYVLISSSICLGSDYEKSTFYEGQQVFDITRTVSGKSVTYKIEFIYKNYHFIVTRHTYCGCIHRYVGSSIYNGNDSNLKKLMPLTSIQAKDIFLHYDNRYNKVHK